MLTEREKFIVGIDFLPVGVLIIGNIYVQNPPSPPYKTFYSYSVCIPTNQLEQPHSQSLNKYS